MKSGAKSGNVLLMTSVIPAAYPQMPVQSGHSDERSGSRPKLITARDTRTPATTNRRFRNPNSASAISPIADCSTPMAVAYMVESLADSEQQE